MTYQLATTTDGRAVWFEPGETIPASFTNPRPAPDHVTALAERMLAEDATGEISDATAAEMRAALANT